MIPPRSLIPAQKFVCEDDTPRLSDNSEFVYVPKETKTPNLEANINKLFGASDIDEYVQTQGEETPDRVHSLNLKKVGFEDQDEVISTYRTKGSSAVGLQK